MLNCAFFERDHNNFVYLTIPAKLDGVSVQAIKRMADAHHSSINDWLEIVSEDSKDTGKKRVRTKINNNILYTIWG